MRIVSMAIGLGMIVAMLAVAVPPAQAQNAPVQVEKLTPDKATTGQPPARPQPKGMAAPKAAPERKGRVGAPSAPKKAPAAAEAKPVETVEAEQPQPVELAKSSLRRHKVMRIDNQPHPRIRPIAVIQGPLGPYGYLDMYMAGQTHLNKQLAKAKAKQGPTGTTPGQPGQAGAAALRGGAFRGSRGGGRY